MWELNLKVYIIGMWKLFINSTKKSNSVAFYL